jgi:aminoglycoside phosphotransferase (APT) family kinase protein
MVPSRIDQIVDAALGCSVWSAERPEGGRIAETYLLELDGEPGRAVCKIGGPSVRTGDVVEPLVLRLVGATIDLPVPAVLASGTLDGETGFGQYWVLYGFREGDAPTPFDSLRPADRRRIVAETGSILGRLHATHQFDRTGGLGRTGGTLCICDPDGLNVPERGRRLARHHPARAGVDWQPVLSHGDLFPGNLLVEGGTITGVLDWGNAHVTTAGYALARAEMRFVDWFRFQGPERRRLRTALREGYREHRSLPPAYPELAGFYKTLWLGQSVDRVVRNLSSRRGRRQMKRHVRGLLPWSDG